MTDLFVYLFQVTLVFVLLYGLYHLVLRNFTFHTLNRIVLLLSIPISLSIPFVHTFLPQTTINAIEIPVFEHFNFDVFQRDLTTTTTTPTFDYWFVLSVIYWIGFSICMIRFIRTFVNLWKLKRTAIATKKDGFHFVEADVPEVFSYFHWIFIPKGSLQQLDPLIIAHEKAHCKQRHTFDILFTELYTIIFWFNPLIYFYRKSLKAVHEFQADQKVLQTNIKTSTYMQLVLTSLCAEKPNHLYSYFNHPILKKRIDMMTKSKSKAVSKLLYILILPIMIVCVLSFKSNDNALPETTTIIDHTTTNDTTFLFPVAGKTIEDITSGFGAKRKHPKIKNRQAHGGIDIRANRGTAVLATADGIVLKAANEGKWGNLIVIKHANDYESWYAHLKGFEVTSTKKVKKGDVIGYVGVTGKTTGPHLHFELKQHGKRLDPLEHLKN